MHIAFLNVLCTFIKRIPIYKRTNLLHIMITATATTIIARPIDTPTTDLMEVTSSSSFSSIGCDNLSFKQFRIHAYFQNNFVKNRKGWYKVR